MRLPLPHLERVVVVLGTAAAVSGQGVLSSSAALVGVD